MTPQLPITRVEDWPHRFPCDGKMYMMLFAASYNKVIKAIAAIAIQLEWTVIHAIDKPYFRTDPKLSLEFIETSNLYLLHFCREPLDIIKSTMETYNKSSKDKIHEEKFRWRNTSHFITSSGECGTVKQALDEADRIVKHADKTLTHIRSQMDFEHGSASTTYFSTRPPREILLEMALLSKTSVPTMKAMTGISGFKTISDVESALDLSFNTPFKGPLFPNGRYDQGALAPKMFFICVHAGKWIVGSTVPRCGDFTWANDICKTVRESRLGSQHMVNSKDAQILAKALEDRSGTSQDIVTLRRGVIKKFAENPTNCALISRSTDSGVALDDKLKPEALCYRCQIVHRYVQVASAGFDTGHLEEHLEGWDWRRHPIETAHACAESVASLCCGMYEVLHSRVAHC